MRGAAVTAGRASGHGRAGGVQVQLRTLVRMPRGELLVEFDPEAGLGRRYDVAGLPAHRLHEQVRVDALPALDALEDEEVRAAGGELDVGRTDDGPAVQVRGE